VAQAGSREAPPYYLQPLQQQISQSHLLREETGLLLCNQEGHKLVVVLHTQIRKDIGETLHGKLTHVLVAMLEEVLSKFQEESLQIGHNLVVEVLHQDADSVEEVTKEKLVEVSLSHRSSRLCQFPQTDTQPQLKPLSTQVLYDSLQQGPSLLNLKLIPQYLIDLVDVVDDAPASHHIVLDFLQTRVDNIEHAVQELPRAGVLVVVPHHVQRVVLRAHLPPEHNLERVEQLGLFRGPMVPVPLGNLLLPKGQHHLILVTLGFGQVPYLPKLVGGQLLVVSSGLYNFWHQQ
jgi:hypothetical protein